MTQETMEAPAESGASSIPDIAALIQDFSTKLDTLSAENAELRAEIQKQKTMVPTFKPMERQDIHNLDVRRRQIQALATENLGQGATLTDSLEGGDGPTGPKLPYVTSGLGIAGVEGNRIPDAMVPHLNKRFDVGDTVRINPAVTREGATRTWGEILDKHGADGIGIVVRVVDFRKTGMWKYRVRTTKVGGFKGIDGFYDYELLPA